MKPHKHAAVIKAWADNPALVVEWRYGGSPWHTCDGAPFWDEINEYRVKPEKVYPVTGMTYDEIWRAVRQVVPVQFSIGVTNAGAPYGPEDVVFGIANAVLRHAIDTGQVIMPSEPKPGLRPHNPYTGLLRDQRDIDSDPMGVLAHHKDETMASGVIQKQGAVIGARSACRDMAIARATLAEVHRALTRRGIHQDLPLNLAEIIATVKD